MNANGPDDVLHAVLPPALEIMTAWASAESDDPALFSHALHRVLADAMNAPDPGEAMVEAMFGMSSLSGILLDELTASTGRSREQVLREIHARYLASS